jgi:hyperosmotically inducible periplasmic protein
MNAQTSRKIIVASGMAVVVAIGVVIFALRSHSVTSAAQTPHPPTPIAETPEIPTPPPAVAQIPDAPAPVAASDSVGSNSADSANPPAVEPKPAHNRAEASTSAIATNDTVTRTGSAADTSAKPATPSVADSADSAKSADERTTPQPISSSPADEQNVGASTAFAASDSQITIDVKSEIAGDGLSKDVNIGVTTTQGVVALTGSLASQDAIDHVKDVAGKVAGVKSVDTSALILASL